MRLLKADKNESTDQFFLKQKPHFTLPCISDVFACATVMIMINSSNCRNGNEGKHLKAHVSARATCIIGLSRNK